MLINLIDRSFFIESPGLHCTGYSGREVEDISDTSIIYDVNLTSYIRDLFDHF
ncbi:MAG: hypothetical protein K6E35_01550 [Bacteroidales bacterium]|nr:hypothetical protein [Bacteroidales bacterium]